MKVMTANEFANRTALDPAWASGITEPIEVTEYVALNNSRITHLSPLLHFTAKGISAEFYGCTHLKKAEGNFSGYVGFDFCGIDKIGELKITGTHPDGGAASFSHCYNLKIAEGDFPGHVIFEASGVQEIGKLVARANQKGEAANFRGCNIQIAKGEFHGGVNFSESNIQKIDVENLKIKKSVIPARTLFDGCELLKIAEGEFPGFVSFANSGVTKIGKIKLGETGMDGLKACFWGCHIKECHQEHLDNEHIRIMPGTKTILTQWMENRKKARTAIRGPDISL